MAAILLIDDAGLRVVWDACPDEAGVPYRHVAELPDSIRETRSLEEQRIYLEAYNATWRTWDAAAGRRRFRSREQSAHRAAITCVRQRGAQRGAIQSPLKEKPPSRP